MNTKKAFTLIELIIVIVIVGILSTLLFRTLADMISANGRIQQEKIMTQELITLQSTINNIAEQYPMIDIQAYKWSNTTQTGEIGTNGFTDKLYLTNTDWSKLSIYQSGTYLLFLSGTDEIKITNPDRSLLTGVYFKVLPTQYHSGTIHKDLDLWHINAQWFWIYWNISYATKWWTQSNKSSYTLQHFIHLQP